MPVSQNGSMLAKCPLRTRRVHTELTRRCAATVKYIYTAYVL